MAKESIFGIARKRKKQREEKADARAGIDILVVLSGAEEPLAGELMEILEVEGDSYERVTGREEALKAVWGGKYKCVYLSSYAIATGEKPPAEFFPLFSGDEARRHDWEIAAGLDVAEPARRKGMPVVVGDFDPRSKEAYEQFGAVMLNKLTQDVWSHYNAIKEAMKGD